MEELELIKGILIGGPAVIVGVYVISNLIFRICNLCMGRNPFTLKKKEYSVRGDEVTLTYNSQFSPPSRSKEFIFKNGKLVGATKYIPWLSVSDENADGEPDKICVKNLYNASIDDIGHAYPAHKKTLERALIKAREFLEEGRKIGEKEGLIN